MKGVTHWIALRAAASVAALDCGHPPDHTGDRRLGGRPIDGDGSMWELAFLIGQQVRFFVTGQAGVAWHPLEVDLLPPRRSPSGETRWS